MKINGLYVGELSPSTTIAGCIEIFENVWPEPQETIQSIEKQCMNLDSGVYWAKAGTVGSGAYQNTRTNKIMDLTYFSDITENMIVQNINNQFYTLLLSATNSYVKRYDIKENLFHENYHMLKYSSDEYYNAHYDGPTEMGRAISAICYLNDDYEGGEIEFVNFKFKIKPQPGMLILFPSNYAYRHIAHPITSGTKYAIVTWVRDRQTGGL